MRQRVIALKRYREALAFCSASVAIRRELLAGRSPRGDGRRLLRSCVYHDLVAFEWAYSYYRRAHAAYLEVHGATHEETIDAAQSVASLRLRWCRRGRREPAVDGVARTALGQSRILPAKATRGEWRPGSDRAVGLAQRILQCLTCRY
jgi:hypothetical protein